VSRVPVHDRECEESIVGGLVLSPAWLDELRSEGLSAGDFYLPNCRHAFEAICALAGRGEVIDTITVAAAIKASGHDRPGAADLVSALANTPAVSHLPAYARRVRGLARLRLLAHAGVELIEIGVTPVSDVAGTLDRAEQLVLTAITGDAAKRPAERAVDLVSELLADLEARAAGVAPVPLSTGLVDLDRQLLGGLRGGQLVVVAARPSQGKTSLVLGIASHASTARGCPVLFFSLEMSRVEIAARLVAMGGVATDRQAAGLNELERRRAEKVRDRLSDVPLLVDDDPSATLASIRSLARRTAAAQGLGLIVVDYLQLVSHPAGETRQTQVAEISRELKRLARELSVPVLVAAQLSRAVESRTDKRPMLADLRESGQIEQDADAVCFIFRPAAYDPEADPGKADVIVAKHRSGPTSSVPLVWLGQRMAFVDPVREERIR
jgi:replicative DNA helicase